MPPRDTQFDEVLEGFRILKQGEGLSPEKMMKAPAVMSAMGEIDPVRATQRLLDDLADLGGSDAEALTWALAVAPDSHGAQTLAARRARLGIPENTAKDRERRAVERLVSVWEAHRADWAQAVYTAAFDSFPMRSSVRIGSFEVKISAFVDAGRDRVGVVVVADGLPASEDYVVIGARAESSILIYGTQDRGWRLEMFGPPLQASTIMLRRDYERPPERIQFDTTGPDGRSTTERYPGSHAPQMTVVDLPADSLETPAVISWLWAPRTTSGAVEAPGLH